MLLYALNFLNNLLNSSNYNYKLYKLDHKYIKNLKKEEDLKIYNIKLKDLYSLMITPKYKKISKFHNKKELIK